jgi:uncharacterized protein YegJ (DUF2314 family)
MPLKTIRSALGAAALALTATAAACQEPGTQDRSDVVSFSDSDPAMEAAKAQGQATLTEFLKRLAAPAADEQDFAVKFNLTPDADAEFIWANNLQVEPDGNLTGALANEPLDQRFQAGERVTIDRSQIVDWAYFKGKVAHGHYTTRVMLNQASPEKAAQIRASLGWRE